MPIFFIYETETNITHIQMKKENFSNMNKTSWEFYLEFISPSEVSQLEFGLEHLLVLLKYF